MLFDLLKVKYPKAQITKLMARQFKENYAFIGPVNEQISVEFMEDGKLSRHNIADEMKEACESIVPDITGTVKDLIISFDPEFQSELMSNILVAGCGNRIRGITMAIESGLAQMGSVKVEICRDPVFVGAVGALKLGQAMPLSEWQQL